MCRPDNNGNILNADSGCHSIHLLNPETHSVTTLIGSGTQGLENGAWINAKLSSPLGVFCCDTVGSIYIGDSGNNGIRVQPPQPAASTYVIAGGPLEYLVPRRIPLELQLDSIILEGFM